MLRNPEMSLAQVLKPFPGFESKYQGLAVADNPIALPGTLDQFAGKPGYDPNLLAGVPMPMGSKVYAWLPRFFPNTYSAVPPNYTYQFVWRLRSLAEQVADASQQRASHFGRLLPGVAQEEDAGGPPAANAALAGPRFVIPTAFESVQIIQNKFLVTEQNSTTVVVQKGTENFAGTGTISPEAQDPAEIVTAAARVTSYTQDPYRAPISPNYPANYYADPKQGAAGLLSQGFYPDAAGWATGGTDNQGYAAGGMFVVYETEAKGDELIVLVSRDNTDPTPGLTWDFDGSDSVFSAIFGTASGTRQSLSTLGVYLLTGTTTGSQASFG